MTFRLDQLRRGQTGRVASIEGNSHTAQRLMAMAMLPGTMVQMVRSAPLGDPIIVQLHQSQISLRRRDAAAVCISFDESA